MARLYALSGGGGAGKTTLVHVLLRKYPEVIVLRRTTTRPHRGDADEAQHFYFVTHEEFEDRRSRGCFVGVEMSSGHYYGIEQGEVEQVLRDHGERHFIMIGGEPSIALKRAFPAAVTIGYVKAPLPDIERRLRSRGDSPEVIEQKMAETRTKLAWEPSFYDGLVENPDGALAAAFRKLEEIMGFVSPSTEF